MCQQDLSFVIFPRLTIHEQSKRGKWDLPSMSSSPVFVVRPESSVRDLTELELCQMAFEHGIAFRSLLASGLATSGVALLRL